MVKSKSASTSGNDRGLLSVLIMRFSALGDVAMTVPVVYSACRCYPDIKFVMVTRPSMTGIFVNPPQNLTVIGADVKSDYVGPSGMWRLLKELRQDYNPDAVVDLHDVLRTKMLRTFASMKGLIVAHVNKGRAGKRALTRRNRKVMLPLISSRARYRETFFKVGLPIENRFDGLYGKEDHAPVAMFSSITPPKTEGERWVGIAPFAAHAGKIYPADKLEKVVEALTACPGIKVFLFGGGGKEAELLGEWEKRFPHVISLAGKKYGFPIELALLNHLDVMVAMDSANMHLAAIAGTKVVSVWGATHPYCGFKGWRQDDSDCVQLNMTCRPCSVFGDKPCFRNDYACLNGITPEMILAKIDKYI